MPFVADMHVDTLRWVVKGYDPTTRHRSRMPMSYFLGHVDLPRLRDGGARVVFFYTVTVPVPGIDLMKGARRSIAAAHEMAAKPGAGLSVVRTKEDLRAALSGEGIAAVLGLEGAYALGQSLEGLDALAEGGLRALGLVHMTPSRAGFSSYGRRFHRDGGLSPFGHALVDEAARLGVVIDLAHANRRTFRDAIRRSSRPVIVSHTGVDAVRPSPRNLTDEQLRMVAETGGVVGIFFASAFLKQGKVRTTATAVARHLCHAIEVAGSDHVGIGSDFDGGIVPPLGLDDCSTYPVLARELSRAGLSADVVDKVMGGNVTRVLAEVLPSDGGQRE